MLRLAPISLLRRRQRSRHGCHAWRYEVRLSILVVNLGTRTTKEKTKPHPPNAGQLCSGTFGCQDMLAGLPRHMQLLHCALPWRYSTISFCIVHCPGATAPSDFAACSKSNIALLPIAMLRLGASPFDMAVSDNAGQPTRVALALVCPSRESACANGRDYCAAYTSRLRT